MKRVIRSIIGSIVGFIVGCLSVSAQSVGAVSVAQGMVSAEGVGATTLTVVVSASTGDEVTGVTVSLSNEAYGLVYADVVLQADGKAVFTQVLTTENILTIDGTALGLTRRVDTLVVTPDLLHMVVLDEQTRQPYALRAELAHDVYNGTDVAHLTWNQEEPALEDDFESYPDFAIDFAPWTGIDGDKAPTAQVQGSYPNAQLKQYATIFNPLTIEPSVWFDYPVLRPYSGAQYVGFLRTADGTANDDYLISPRVKIGHDFVVRFMAKAADKYNEHFRVGIAAGVAAGQTPTQQDFVWLTEGTDQYVDYRRWQAVEYSLADYVGQEVYLCIHYLSQATFMLMVDDFYVGPSETASEPLNRYEHHTIVVDGDSVGTATRSTFTTPPLSAGKHRVGVYSSYRHARTDTVWTEVEVPDASHYAALTLQVATNNGTATDQMAALLSADSTHTQYTHTLTGDQCVWLSLPLGDYTLSMEEPYFVPCKQSLHLSKDTTVQVVLEEKIIRPYNLYAEVTRQEDAYRGTLMWNRNLGFHEGFEDYEAFTQTFDNWTTYDGDGGTNYAISLGGYTITMGDYGSSNQSSALIFNPYMTSPAVYQDTYFLPREGEQYVAFFCPQGKKADDWLVAKKIKVESNWVVRFWAKAYSEQYPETVDVMVRTEGDLWENFQSLGQQVFKTGEWTQYEVSLAAYEGQEIEVAFHYISNDQWLAQMDEVYIGPYTTTDTEGEDVGNASYNVYLDEVLLGKTAETQYDLGELTVGKHTAAVQAVYRSGESEVATLEFEVHATGIPTIETSEADSVSKYLHHGRIIIRRADRYYDVIGQLLRGDNKPK